RSYSLPCHCRIPNPKTRQRSTISHKTDKGDRSESVAHTPLPSVTMPEGAPPARGAGRGRPRGTRGRGRGAASSAAPSTEGPTSTSRPSSALGTASATAVPSRTATPNPPATRGTSASRFRPRVVRRDEAARDAIARQELEKDNARAKAEARAQARSRGRSRRARGDAMGRGGFMSRAAVASGPFSQMTTEGGGRSGGGWGG
ncbi:RNA polymerase III RPC4, partial [Colletotrichum scovillei]